MVKQMSFVVNTIEFYMSNVNICGINNTQKTYLYCIFLYFSDKYGYKIFIDSTCACVLCTHTEQNLHIICAMRDCAVLLLLIDVEYLTHFNYLLPVDCTD